MMSVALFPFVGWNFHEDTAAAATLFRFIAFVLGRATQADSDWLP